MGCRDYGDNDFDATDGCILLICCLAIPALLGACVGLFLLQAIGAW